MRRIQTTRRASGRRASLVLLLMLVVTIGATACGSDDDSDSNQARSGGQASATGTNNPAAGGKDRAPVGNDKALIRKLMKDIQTYHIAGDGEAYCGSLTEAGQRQVVWAAKTLGLPGTCEEFIVRTAKATRESGTVQKPTVILRITLNGNRAVATVSDGGRPPQPFTFVKQDGEWKVPDPGFKSALQPDPARQPQTQ